MQIMQQMVADVDNFLHTFCGVTIVNYVLHTYFAFSVKMKTSIYHAAKLTIIEEFVQLTTRNSHSALTISSKSTT